MKLSIMKKSKASSVYIRAFQFNQDGSCFIAATTAGFRVYTCSPLSEFARRENISLKSIFQNVRFATMLYRSSCFALVTFDEPQKVYMWDDRKTEIVSVIWCRQTILNVLLGRDIICVVAETAVYIYQSGAVTPLSVIITGPNPKGLCALSECSPLWHLTCPTTTPGVVRLQTAACLETNAGLLIAAHRSSLSYLTISSCGKYIATSSEIGTLIRLFSSSDGAKINEFRLGSIPHNIRCISFRGDGRFIIVGSNSKTIHIFKVFSDRRDTSYHEELLSDDIKNQSDSYSNAIESTGSSGVYHQASSHKDMLFSSLDKEDATSLTPVTTTVLTTATMTTTTTDGRATTSKLKHELTTALPLNIFPFARTYSDQLVAAFSGLSSRFWNVLPSYFDSQRSFAQFYLPSYTNGDLDVRNPETSTDSPKISKTRATLTTFKQQLSGYDNSSCWIMSESSFSGPQCAFAGYKSNHFYVIQHDGFFYEARFDAQTGGECQLLSILPWFAPREDFVVEAGLNSVCMSRSLHEVSESLSDENTALINKTAETTLSETALNPEEKEVSINAQHKPSSAERINSGKFNSESTDNTWQLC